jgi:hypothetical protein
MGRKYQSRKASPKRCCLQKVAQRLHQRLLGMGLGNAGAQLVEAQQVAQHAPESAG